MYFFHGEEPWRHPTETRSKECQNALTKSIPFSCSELIIAHQLLAHLCFMPSLSYRLLRTVFLPSIIDKDSFFSFLYLLFPIWEPKLVCLFTSTSTCPNFSSEFISSYFHLKLPSRNRKVPKDFSSRVLRSKLMEREASGCKHPMHVCGTIAFENRSRWGV